MTLFILYTSYSSTYMHTSVPKPSYALVSVRLELKVFREYITNAKFARLHTYCNKVVAEHIIVFSQSRK